MISGMTGFGSAEFSSGKIKGNIEIKSLNHRYLDIGYFLPMGFSSVESKIRDLLATQIERGRITVSIRITGKPSQTVSFNKEAVSTYLRYAKALQKDFNLKGELSIDRLIQLPGVVDTRETVISAESLWPAIEKDFRLALNGLINMRKREGKSLVADIDGLLKHMLLQSKRIQLRAKLILVAKKKKLADEEYLSYEKSADVNEEISRLSHHIDEFRQLLRQNIVVGKKLDFIAQEMQRETNTIGSKLQDKIVSNAVITLKSKIEKIREQAQNIE